MAQPLLKRRLNPLLLISTVAALVLVAGVSVVALDRIDTIQAEKEKKVQTIKDLKSTIEKLEAEKGNLSKKLERARRNYSELKRELGEKKSVIQNKTKKIQDLKQQLENAQTSLQPGVDRSTVRSLNSSLAVVCKFGSPSNGANPELAADMCRRHGHEVGKQ